MFRYDSKVLEPIRFEKVMVTPEIATELLKKNTCNRRVNERIVDFYARLMSEGKWKANGQPITIDIKDVITNGQHRLLAIVKFGGAVPMVIIYGVEDGSYETTDIHHVRKLSDFFYVAGIKNDSVVSSIVSRCNDMGLGFSAIGNFEGKNASRARGNSIFISPEEKIALYELHPEIYQNASKIATRIYSRDKRHIFTKVEIGALYSFLVIHRNYTESIVEMFLESIFDEALPGTEITRMLYNRLVDDKYQRTKHMSAQERNMLLAKTWNYYIEGKKVKSLKWNKELEGIIIFK